MRKRNFPGRGRKRICSKCGEPTENATNGYCRRCKNEYNRTHRQKHSEFDDEQKKRANARAYLNVYVRRGKIQKKPCEHEGCGITDVMAFHTDYDKPLEPKWYCKQHHAEERKRR